MAVELCESGMDLEAYGRGLLRGRLTRLRPLEEDDLAALAAWWDVPTWMAHQTLHVLPRPRAKTEEMFRSWSANGSATSVGFSIETISPTELVGHVTLYGIDPVVRCGTLAVIIGAPHTDRGLGTDALRVMTRYAFEELGLNKVELRVWADNPRAVHVYRRLGFALEGTRRAVGFHRGAFRDEHLMGLLAAEYRGAEYRGAERRGVERGGGECRAGEERA